MEEGTTARPSRVERLPEVWLLASPFALLDLLRILGVKQRVIAERVGVPSPNISMWYGKHQPVPRRHATVLRVWAQRLLREKEMEWGKALEESPTADDHDRLLRLYYDPISQWINRVHLEAGTYDQKIRTYIMQLEVITLRDTLRPEDEEDIRTLAQHLTMMVDMKRATREAEAAEDGAQEQGDVAQEA